MVGGVLNKWMLTFVHTWWRHLKKATLFDINDEPSQTFPRTADRYGDSHRKLLCLMFFYIFVPEYRKQLMMNDVNRWRNHWRSYVLHEMYIKTWVSNQLTGSKLQTNSGERFLDYRSRVSSPPTASAISESWRGNRNSNPWNFGSWSDFNWQRQIEIGISLFSRSTRMSRAFMFDFPFLLFGFIWV